MSGRGVPVRQIPILVEDLIKVTASPFFRRRARSRRVIESAIGEWGVTRAFATLYASRVRIGKLTKSHAAGAAAKGTFATSRRLGVRQKFKSCIARW